MDDRLAVLETILAHPPNVHEVEPGVFGNWAAEPECYRFMAGLIGPGSRTIETGLGISTALLTAWGAHHTGITASADEVTRMNAYLDARGIDRSRLSTHIGMSDEILPRLVQDGALDLVFIDGCHGWPVPIIDWFYASRRLQTGGVVVLDDRDLRSVRWPRRVPEPGSAMGSSRRRSPVGRLSKGWRSRPL